MTQIIMACELNDAGKQDRYIRDGVSRISEALFRVANSTEITELSLEVDTAGAELIPAREEREKHLSIRTEELGD